MQRKHILKSRIRKLVNEFESREIDRTAIYFEEKELLEIISFYQNEDLVHKAFEAIDIALDQYQYRLEFYLIKIKLLVEEKQYSDALTVIETCESIAPNELDVQLLKAKVLLNLNYTFEALELVETLKRSNLGHVIADIYAMEADIYEYLKDYNKMYSCIVKATKIAPKSRYILEKLWMAVEFSKQYKDSIRVHREIINQDAYNTLAWYNLGHAYACVGEYDLAIDYMEYAFLIDEDFQIAYEDCAEICMQTCQYLKALNIYLEMLDKFGPDSQVFACIGDCYIHLNDYNSAFSYLKKAYKLDPHEDEVIFQLGSCYLNNNKPNKAIKMFTRALSMNDQREEYFGALAQAYAITEEFTLADYYFRKATETGPEQDIYWIQHAEFLINNKLYDNALNVLEEAEYHTYSEKLLFAKSACLFSLNEEEAALKLLEEALEENFEAHEYLYSLNQDLRTNENVQAILKYFEA